MKSHIIFVIIIIFSSAVQLGYTTRVKNKMYDSVDTKSFCFRRQNGTHQFGCTSKKSGNVGVIHFVETEEDILWLQNNATAGPYMVVLPFSMFTLNNLQKFQHTDNVNGILLSKFAPERPVSYSPEDTCPNRYSGYKTCDSEWNPYGSCILLQDWSFPIFYLKNYKDLEPIRACHKIHNADHDGQNERSLCSLEMKTFMYAAVNSEVCLRRSQNNFNLNPISYCDPLHDKNIHWPLTPMSDKISSVIMVTARLDANSLFDGISPGAGSSVVGVVTLLATAYYLKHLNPQITDTNVIFTLFNGEMFDYIGSSRVVYDLKEGKFDSLGKSLKLDQIKTVIELGQLTGETIYLHINNLARSKMIDNLKNNLQATVLESSVPPASIQSFLKENSSLPAFVIAGHGKNFTNKYYGSILDDAEGLNYFLNNSTKLTKHLTKITSELSLELYRILTGKETKGNSSMVEELVGKMLPCYLISANCDLFHAASPPGAILPNQTLPLYISVYSPYKPKNDVTTLTGLLLALLTGDYLHYNQSVCHEKHLFWATGFNATGLCINTTLNFSDATSPAFIIPDYQMKSGKYSTWTESVWQEIGIRMFLKPSAAVERLSLIVGGSVATISFIMVWFVSMKAHIIFDNRTADL